MSAPLSFRVARESDVAATTALINAAYRGETSRRGWTTEAHLLEGRRIDEDGLRALLGEAETLILLCFEGDALTGSTLLRKKADGLGYLGMLVVNPAAQARGVGRRFMREAEEVARRLWGVARMEICVVNHRAELIAWYERRGYALTGERLPFPFEDGLSVALVEGIELLVLEKRLVAVATKDESPDLSPPPPAG